ncbi:suppressor protein SRP40 [Stegastes partitus]|uniref:Suppressor protein SRP40-like n=1 Tax=Stegastes partitus TaxID=144197 RepID=A0A3B4ZZV6_9TELE|nr:PREDICTED: suppressor protein SRP40-like [Stegastes partitus]
MGRKKVYCALCNLSEETKITGALSTKDEVTAHQNCLLFSSGICCRNSPEFDDLFGFSVDDVLDEVKRGHKLPCYFCKKKGATAGCEVKRCKKSYHYPCALKDGARTIEEPDIGCYGLYCLKHYNKLKNNDSSVNGTSNDETKAGPSKVYCLTCEKIEGKISLDNLSNSITMRYCDKHAPPSYKKKINRDSAVAGPSGHNSDSNSSSSVSRSSSKRPLTKCDKQEETPSKRKCETLNGIITEDSSDSDDNKTDIEMDIFAPLESDLDESANSAPKHQPVRNDAESTVGSTSGNQAEDESRDTNKDEDEPVLYTDAESQSLLLPVKIRFESSPLPSVKPQPSSPTVSATQPKDIVANVDEVKTAHAECCPVQSPGQPTNGASVPEQQSSPDPAPSPDQDRPASVTGSPPCTSSADTPAPPETMRVSLLSSSSCSPTAHTTNPQHGIDATSFWKSCNAARCTQAIFTDFNNVMNEISSRILSDQASQEDYDLALSVMAVSGKLTELVAKQQGELQRKLVELQQAEAAMKDVVSALRK